MTVIPRSVKKALSFAILGIAFLLATVSSTSQLLAKSPVADGCPERQCNFNWECPGCECLSGSCGIVVRAH